MELPWWTQQLKEQLLPTINRLALLLLKIWIFSQQQTQTVHLAPQFLLFPSVLLSAARNTNSGGVSILSVKSSKLHCFIICYKNVTLLSLWFVPPIPYSEVKENNPLVIGKTFACFQFECIPYFSHKNLIFMGVCYITAESLSQMLIWSSSLWECGGRTGSCVLQGTCRWWCIICPPNMACIHMPFPLLMEMNDPHVHLCPCKDPAVLLHSLPRISLCSKQVKITHPHSQLGSLSQCCHAVDVANIRSYSSIFLYLDNYPTLIASITGFI